MPSTTTYERGRLVVVSVPFSDHSGVKLRPALVVSPVGFHEKLPDVIVSPVSSQPRWHRRPGRGDQPLSDWRAAGLRRPSTVRVSKLLAIDKRIIKRTLGSVSAEDMAAVENRLREALGIR
jgi:mRNA-degrading endonuclease toxin of MazEF toxin-antitoxin module